MQGNLIAKKVITSKLNIPTEYIIYAPYFLLGIVSVMTWHFNKSQLSILSLFLIFSLFFVNLYYNNPSKIVSRDNGGLFFQFLSILSVLNITYLYYGSNRGLITRNGLLKLIVILGEIPILSYSLKYYSTEISNVISKYPVFFSKLPILNTALLPTAVFILFSLMIVMVPPKDNKITPSAYILIMSIVFFSLNFKSPWNNKGYLFIVPLNYLMIAFSMILAFYTQMWGRVFNDELTGLFNRRALDETLPKMGATYALTMIDIDHFKKFNDTYGHQAGDEVLQFVAKKLKNCKTGTTFRYGGEEFCILFNGKNGESIISEVDAIRRDIEGSSLILANAKKSKKKGKRVSVTISAGIASSSQFITNPNDVIKLADGALYRAKKKGRNRVEIEKRKTLR